MAWRTRWWLDGWMRGDHIIHRWTRAMEILLPLEWTSNSCTQAAAAAPAWSCELEMRSEMMMDINSID